MVADSELLSVGQVWRRSRNALAREFKHSVWVEGEVKSLREWRGNWYITLIEPGNGNDGSDISLDVACSPKRRLVVQGQLASVGLTLVAGMRVRLQGPVTIGRLGKLQLELLSLDTQALVGAAELERRRLIQSLENEGLFEKNKRLELALVPFRVGLVGSDGSDGVKDFLTRLSKSRYPFEIVMRHSPVQGPAAPVALANAINSLANEDVDVVVVVRGGGGELDAFDKEPVVRAVANCSRPAWVGIGHTADECLSDRVAHQYFATPTACADALVRRVDAYFDRIAVALRQIQRRVHVEHANVEHRVQGAVRRIDHHVRYWHQSQHERFLRQTQSLQRCQKSIIEKASAELGHYKQSVSLLDPSRQVSRGYAILRDTHGKVIKKASATKEGEHVSVQLSDGRLNLTVQEVERSESP